MQLFILATNLLDEERSLIAASNVAMPPEKWTNDLILKEYKDQQTTERGFRFIIDIESVELFDIKTRQKHIYD